MHEHLRHRILNWWAQLVANRPRWVLAVALSTAVACVAITVGGLPIAGKEKLRFQSDRNKLIDQDIPWNRNFNRWTHSFKGTRDLTVVIDPCPDGAELDEAALARAERLADELGPTLLRHEAVNLACWGYAPETLPPQAIRMLDMADFQRRLERIERSRFVLESPTFAEMLTPRRWLLPNSGSPNGPDTSAIAQQIEDVVLPLMAGIERSLHDPSDRQRPFDSLGADAERSGRFHYLKSDNDRLFFIRVTPRRQTGALNEIGRSIHSIRKVISQVAARHPKVVAGLTGIEVIEADETNAATRDSTRSAVVAFVLILLFLVVAFHSWRTPLMAMASLLIAIAWSFGFLTLSIGHLQVISAVFTVILLGLGIAYGVHIASRLELVRHRYTDDIRGFGQAITNSIVTMGPGILTGCLTTAAAFTTTMFTKFAGVAEMGQIAAAGIIFCMLAMFSVFPALLRVFKPRHRHITPLEDRWFHLFEERWVMPFARRPKATLTVAVGLTVASVWAVSGAYPLRRPAEPMTFDYDLMALLPEDVDSVRWQQHVARAGGRSIWHAVSMAGDLDEARDLVDRLRTKDTVAPRIGGIGLLFPPDESEKIRMLSDLRSRLGNAITAARAEPTAAADVPRENDLGTRLTLLRRLIQATAAAEIPIELRQSMARLDQAMQRTLIALQQLEPEQQQARLARLDQQYANWRRHMAQRLDHALDPSPLSVDQLPPAFRRLYEGSDGTLALEIFPSLPPPNSVQMPSLLAPQFLPFFVSDLQSVDPNVTGVPVQIYRSGKLIKNSYIIAGMFALVLVFVLLLLDFQSMSDALLCLVPVTMVFTVTFGVMYLIGMQINPANIIVLPLMFGIGVDTGVHMLHRFRQDPVNRPLGLTAGSGKGITLTSLTAVIGFGSLLLANHRGIRSLGFVLALGIGLTMLACWMVMPACLELKAGRTMNGSRLKVGVPPSRRGIA